MVNAYKDAGVNVEKADTLASLEEKIHKVEHKLYPNTIRELLK